MRESEGRITRIDPRQPRPESPRDPESIIEHFQSSPYGRYYVDAATMARHRKGFQHIGDLLGIYPGILDALSDAHDGQGPDDGQRVTMLINNEYPIIFSQFGRSRSVLVPILACTLNALDDAWESVEGQPGKFAIFRVNNPFLDETQSHAVEVAEDAWESAMHDELFFLDYESDRMVPESYFVYPAIGAFNNEAYYQALSPAPLTR